MKTITFTEKEFNLVESAIMTAAMICGEEQDYENQHALDDLSDKLHSLQ